MKITETDFEQLIVNSMNWNEYYLDWEKQEGRFEDIDFKIQESPSIDYSFLRAYWIPQYPAVMFAKAFLESLGYAYRIYYDTADNTYMLTTNYGGKI